MLTFLADENFHRAIVRGLLRRRSELDIVRVQDVGLSGVDDPTVLEWCAQNGRLLLTHDVVTITKFAYERVANGLAMPGVIEVKQSIGHGQAIDDILLIAECSLPDEHEGQVLYIPLK